MPYVLHCHIAASPPRVCVCVCAGHSVLLLSRNRGWCVWFTIGHMQTNNMWIAVFNTKRIFFSGKDLAFNGIVDTAVT